MIDLKRRATKRRRLRPPVPQKEPPYLGFRLLPGRRISVGRGLEVRVSYDGSLTHSQVIYLDDVVMPLLAAAGAMSVVLHRTLTHSFPDMPSMFEELPQWLTPVKDAMRRALPGGGGRC